MLQKTLTYTLLACWIILLNHGAVVKKSGGDDFSLKVGKPQKPVGAPKLKDAKKEIKKEPTSDVIPQQDRNNDTIDRQSHKEQVSPDAIETGMPPKYPLKTMSAEATAHDNEIGGCRDHPRASRVCKNCGNRNFAAEHESYTYSYCRKSCRHCDPELSSFHTFWRLRAASQFDPTWMVKEIEFYPKPTEYDNLATDPQRAYASSSYPGFKPSYAFDGNNKTSWYPSGWGLHDNNDDWIGFEFPVAVRVHAIRMVLDEMHRTAAPQKIFVEASDKKDGPFTTKWKISNPTYEVDNVYKLLQCPVLWRKYEGDEGAYCFRLIAKFETWEKAREECVIEGGELATISTDDEKRFLTDELNIGGFAWIGLNHKDQAYYWQDRANSSYKNWKAGWSYSEVQKQNLNCVATDQDGFWYNFHCTNKYYFVCKKKLVPEPAPREDLIIKAWPYDPEIPPMIFLYPNVTVPVINTKNLEPGVFPDENGKVPEEEEEETTVDDLLYEQTVEHLKEKGLTPSEEITNDSDKEETDFTQQLNKIALKTHSRDDFRNETESDKLKFNSTEAVKQAKALEEQSSANLDQNFNQYNSTDGVKQGSQPVVSPPSDGPDGSNGNNTLPRIVNGKPVESSPVNPSGVGKPNAPVAVQENSTGDSYAQPGDTVYTTPTPAVQSGNPDNFDKSNPPQATTNQQSTSQQPNAEGGNNANVSRVNQPQQQQQQQQQPQQQQTQNDNNSNQNGNNGQQNANNQPNEATNNNNNNNNNNNQNGNNNQQQNAQQQNNQNNQQQNNQNNQQQNNQNNQQQNNQNNQQQNNQNSQQQNNANNNQSGSQQDSNNNNNGNNSGLPPVMGGPAPQKIPEPPVAKEGTKDNDSERSVGGQADVMPDDASTSENDSNDENANGDNNDNDENNENNNENDNANNNANDANNANNENNQSSTIQKPIPNQGKQSSETVDKSTNVGGINNQQSNDFMKLQKPKVAGIRNHKVAHKKSKGIKKPHMKKVSPIKVAKQGRKMKKVKTVKQVKTAKIKHHKKVLKKEKVARKPEEDAEEGSGSGEEGDDEDVDDVLESITNGLW